MPEDLKAENEELRELAWELYCLAFPTAVDYEDEQHVLTKYSPCATCMRIHGDHPCASTSSDLSDTICGPIRATLVAERMKELGIEVSDG